MQKGTLMSFKLIRTIRPDSKKVLEWTSYLCAPINARVLPRLRETCDSSTHETRPFNI